VMKPKMKFRSVSITSMWPPRQRAWSRGWRTVLSNPRMGVTGPNVEVFKLLEPSTPGEAYRAVCFGSWPLVHGRVNSVGGNFVWGGHCRP
jgi:hypothetical protein